MNIFRTIYRRRGFLLAAMLGLSLSAHAETFPTKTIRILVGYSPGGGVDTVARLLAAQLTAQLGQQVIVENRAGAAGLIAGDAVSKAAPDGYTLLLGESGLLIAQHLRSSMNFDPIKSFSPIAGLFYLPLMVVASNDVPARNAKELVSLLKASPGKYSYASSGVGTVQHLGFEMLKGQTGTFVVHVPYRGASQIVADVMGGQVPIGVVSAMAGLTQSKAGKLQAVAMMSQVDLPGVENVTPMSDALPGFSVAPRLMLLAPAGTPAAAAERLSEAVRAALSNPDVIRAASQQGAVPAYLPAAELATDLVRESKTWKKIIVEQKIVAN